MTISSTIPLEEKMFSTIDDRLINISQWFVRQLELYTLFTRDMFIRKCFFISGAFFLLKIMCGTVILFLSEGNLYMMSIPLFISIFPAALIMAALKISWATGRRDDPSILPRVVHTRRDDRRRARLSSLTTFMTTSLLYMMWHDKYITLGYGSMAGLAATATCIEYLLCTISLPPGEKKKIKQEREMRNAIPGM